MTLKSVTIAAAIAAIAFTASSDAFAAKKKNHHAHNNGFKQEQRHRVKHKGLPMRVILRKIRNKGYTRLAVRDGRLPGYKVKACRNGKKFLLGVNRWGGIKWRERTGKCFRFKNFKNYGNQIVLKFKH